MTQTTTPRQTQVGNAPVFPRGATILFTTTFRDFNCDVTQPVAATVNILCLNAAGNAQQNVQLMMTPPVAPAVSWTAMWDTRGIGAGPVQYSVHTGNPSIPEGVGDGNLVLAANAANLLSF
jgi:hypothetical protein